MEDKKLNPSRSDYLITGYLVCGVLLFYAAASLYLGTFHRNCYLLIGLAIMDMLCFVYALQQRAYYMFMPDGIYIYKRPNVLLTKILWTNVYSCTVMKRNRNSNYPYYFVLIMKETALIHDQLAITCSGAISDHAAKNYMLHRSAERLGKNKITTEQFLQQEVYLISVTKSQLEQVKGLWYKSG